MATFHFVFQLNVWPTQTSATATHLKMLAARQHVWGMQRILHGNTVSRQQWHIKLWQCTIRPMTARLAKNQLTDIIGWGLTIDRRNPDPNTSKCTLCLTEQKSCQSLLWNFSLLGWIILDFFLSGLAEPLKNKCSFPDVWKSNKIIHE